MDGFWMKLPATSANLGPGFDAVGLALGMLLEVDAWPADAFSIDAEGRGREVIGQIEGNLLLDTYRALAPSGPALRLRVRNGIPLAMGCGSSAAALLGGVLLANNFGELGWTGQQVLEEACRREGHPDNVAACFHGGMTVSAMRDGKTTAATLGGGLGWRLVLALPAISLATEKARALLPPSYSRADAVENLQATALLVSAFALGRPDLLAAGTRDRMHQPYRMAACPLLASLLPLSGTGGIHSVTLSGAGPAVLLIVDEGAPVESTIRAAAGHEEFEVLETRIGAGFIVGTCVW